MQIKKIIITQEEIKMATRPNIYKNRKKYSRKNKFKNNNNDDYEN